MEYATSSTIDTTSDVLPTNQVGNPDVTIPCEMGELNFDTNTIQQIANATAEQIINISDFINNFITTDENFAVRRLGKLKFTQHYYSKSKD